MADQYFTDFLALLVARRLKLDPVEMMAQITEWSRRASVLSGYVDPAYWAELPLDEMQAAQCAIFAILTKHGFNTAGLAAIGPVLRGGEVRPGLWRRSIVPLRQAVEEAQANPLARPVFLHLTATPEHNQPEVMAIPRGIIVDRQPGHPEEWGAAIRDRPNFMGTAFVTFNLTAILGALFAAEGFFSPAVRGEKWRVRWREELREHQTSMAAERDRLERRAREAAAEWKAWNDREQAAGRASPELEAALALAAEAVR